MASKFSQRHYEAMAEVFQDLHSRRNIREGELSLEEIEREIADMFRRDSASFHQVRFHFAGVDFDEPPRLTIGIMLTRKGRSVQWIVEGADDNEDNLRILQEKMMQVWAGRADTGFARHHFKANQEQE